MSAADPLDKRTVGVRSVGGRCSRRSAIRSIESISRTESRRDCCSRDAEYVVHHVAWQVAEQVLVVSVTDDAGDTEHKARRDHGRVYLTR